MIKSKNISHSRVNNEIAWDFIPQDWRKLGEEKKKPTKFGWMIEILNNYSNKNYRMSIFTL